MSVAWTECLPEAFRAYQAGRRIEEVECIIADTVGMSRGKAMPAGKFDPGLTTFLPISLFYQTVTGDYVDMDIVNQWMERDVVLTPDMGTASAVPWAEDVTLQVIHDLRTMDGVPLPIAPRNVLRRVLDLYALKGWRPIVAPELEFYIVKPNVCLLYTSPSPRNRTRSRMPSSA